MVSLYYSHLLNKLLDNIWLGAGPGNLCGGALHFPALLRQLFLKLMYLLQYPTTLSQKLNPDTLAGLPTAS